MKKFLLLTFIASIIGILIPSKIYATDITVGATTWYAWWEAEQGGNKMDADPTFMYGPALAVKFNDDFNLTFVYLYGKFDAEEAGGKVKRNDSDLALNYRVHDYFKVFAGVKYMTFSSPDFDHDGIGPGLGLSATYPVTENLFLLATLSGFHLWGKEKYTNNHPSDDYKEYGFNSTLSLAYYIASASTTVSLGGRFQYIKTDFDSNEHTNGDSSMKSKIYGVTLTATYTFSI